MKTTKVAIPVSEEDNVSGILAVPEDFQIGKTTAVIFAHGAGNDMNNPLIVYLANGLFDAGYLTLRFNFPYKEKGKKAPDSQKKLVQTWRSVYDFLENHPKFGTRDSLCDLSQLRSVLSKLKESWDLEVIEGGDHSFNLPRSATILQEDIYSRILDKTKAWLKNPVAA